MVKEGDLLWTPDEKRVARAHITAFTRWLAQERGLEFDDYEALWRWSVTDLDAFWAAVWDHFGIRASKPYDRVLGKRTMPGAEWFPGARLNYAETVLTHGRDRSVSDTAMYFLSENTALTPLSWDDLGARVRKLATELRRLGIGPGDRVAAYMPNTPDAVVAMYATTAIGAIWASCSPDFGIRGVLDRLQQIEPKLLFCVDGYTYGGKPFDRRDAVRDIIGQLPSLQHVVHHAYLDPRSDTPPTDGALRYSDLLTGEPVAAAAFEFEQVEFDHPLWILFSSGTTGLPKPIVHGHGGIVVEQTKLMHFHMEVHPGQTVFFYTTTGWMMWNFICSVPLAGGIPVLYDGNPAYPEPGVLWKMAQDSGAALFGASPTYVEGMKRAGVVPGESYDLSKLESIVLAGSPVTPECAKWFYDNVGEDLWMASGSGGTDICSGFVGGVMTLPVYAGEIQARSLGVAAYAFNDAGEAVVDEVGEMVITEPMPSMPLYFWGDTDHERYRESYFDMFPGKWRQGDFFRVNARGGCFVLGRSDATLNRYGVRIGTAEVYRVLAELDEVVDSLIVNLDLPGGGFFMPLFVRLRDGLTLDDDVADRIRRRLRQEYSPRHVPDRIFQVDDIPYTLTGKKMEVPVRRILTGSPAENVANPSAMRNPESLRFFVDYARTQTDYTI